MSMLVRNEIKTAFRRGVWGLEAEEFFKKSNKMEAFPLFFCFLAGLPRSQNYELAP